MGPNDMNAAKTPNTNNLSDPSAIEQAIAEVSASPTPMSAPMGAPVKKSGKGMVLGMIIFAILAIGGIGFGVWAMMDGNTQKTNLEKQISDLRTQNNQLLGQIAGDDGGGEVSAVDPEDYIYVGEWGLKIKKPEGLSTPSYKFAQGAGYTKIVVWGVNCSTNGQCQYFPDFADIEKNDSGLGNIYRYPKDFSPDSGSSPVLVFSDESWNYYSYHIQTSYSADHQDNIEADWELSSIDLIWDMLTTSENYSQI